VSNFKRSLATLGVAALVALTAACSTPSPTTSENPNSGDKATTGSMADLLPKDIREAGHITGGSNFAANPIDFYDDQHQPAGVMIDLLAAAADRLGITIDWTEVAYPALIPALRTQQVVVTGAQMSKTAANADIVNYFAFYEASSSLLIKKGTSISAESDLCGKVLGVTSGSTIDQATGDTINSNCSNAGKDSVEVRAFASPTAGSTAVRSGQIVAYLEGTPQVVGQAKADADLDVALEGQFAKRVTGNAFPKERLQLTKAFQSAMNAMIDDGEYAEILTKWGLESMAMERTLVNEEIQIP
jgi:polar amino acid transport system substrate-binding protein